MGKGKGKLWIVLGVLVVLLSCGALQSLRNSTSTSGVVSQAAQTKATREPTAAPTPKPVSSLTYAEIADNHKTLTDAQFDAYCKPLIGQVIRWTGWVEDVKDTGNGGELAIDMSPPEEILSVKDFSFAVPKDDVLKYDKDAKVTFQGEIRSLSKGLFGSLMIGLDKVAVSK